MVCAARHARGLLIRAQAGGAVRAWYPRAWQSHTPYIGFSDGLLFFRLPVRPSETLLPPPLAGEGWGGAVAARTKFAARQPSGSANRHPDPPPRERRGGSLFADVRVFVGCVPQPRTRFVGVRAGAGGAVRAWYPRAWQSHTPYAAWLGRLKGFSDGLFGFNFVEAALSDCFAPYPAIPPAGGGWGGGGCGLGKVCAENRHCVTAPEDSRLRGNDGIWFFRRPFGFSGCQTAADSTTKGRPP